MNYVALYRKYRPDTFDGVIGQEHITQTLKNQILHDKVSHAYLFTGTRGTGKTSTAKIFARAINCVNNKDGNPCLKCDVCQTLSGNSMDIIEMDAASNNGVDYARDIREKVQYPPAVGRYKVYIIDEVHMLSQGAFNALLKTLEEPPKHAVFILCTTEVHKIPATILSRCMRFDFKLVPTPMLAKHIAYVFDKEKKQYTQDAVNAIAIAGEGSVRDCLSIADRCYTMSQDKLTYDAVMSVLGVSSRQKVAELVDSVLSNNTGKILWEVSELINQGKDVARLTKDVAVYFRDMLIVKTCNEYKQMLMLPDDVLNSMKEAVSNVTATKLLYCIDTLAQLENTLKFTLAPQMQLEATLLRLATSTGEVDCQGLDKRLSRLERQADNINQDTLLIIDRNSADSIWKGAKAEIDKLNKPLFSAVWKEIKPELKGDSFVVNCTEGEYNLLFGEYLQPLQNIIMRLVSKQVVLNKITNVTQQDIDKQLKQLGDNVKFEERK